MRSFEEIPDIAERIKRSKMELQESGFYWASEWDSQSCCDQDYVNNFKKGWESRQTEVDELQKRVDAAFRVLSQLNDLDDEAHKRWKREACMFSQGESSAYEHSVRLLEQALNGGEE